MKIYSKLICTLFFISMSAYSACNTNEGGAVPESYTISPGVITVQRDAAVGEVIATYTTPASGVVVTCTAENGYYAEMVLFSTPTAISHVYQTNVPGVGVSVGTSWYFENPATFQLQAQALRISFGPRTISFVKTGPISPMAMNSGLLARVYGDGDGLTALGYNLAGGTAVSQVACSITTPSLAFPIGDIPASSFGASVGTVPTGAQNTQNLGLECDASANINVSLQGTQNPDVATTNVLALTGQGNADVASGVGVQLVYNGSPLEIDNNVALKQSAGGQEMLPITARYYQTKATVTPGKANASATLNLTYQ